MNPVEARDHAVVVRAAALAPLPWRNGGGTTREIYAAPPGPHAFPAWRLSLATIAADGRFSTFPGVDRSLLLLSPTVLELTVDGVARRLAQHDVLDFAGEASVVAATGGTTSQALNLMVCRACGSGSWRLREYDGPQRLSRADAAALVLLDGSATVEGQQLQRHDTVVLARTSTSAEFRAARVAVVDVTAEVPAPERPTGTGTESSPRRGKRMSTSQYVVLGAGLAGAATTLSLARRGHEVTVVERTEPAAHDGSSHGSARIFRYAYPESFYAQLVVRSRPLWDELERLAGQQLITPTGSLDFGGTRNPRRLAEVLAEVGVEHELLSQDEARARWPEIAFDTEVLWHPGAGVIDAATAVRVMLAQAREYGARVLTGWPVAGIGRTGTGYRVSSAVGDVLDAEKVVVCAGGWLPKLLGDLPLPAGFLSRMPEITVSQEYAYHFPYRDGEPVETADVWPTFIHKNDQIQTYSLPGGRDAEFRGQKLAEYNGGRRLPSAAEQNGIVDPRNRQRVVEYVERYLPGLVPEPYAETTCLFTNTPTEDFVIDGVDDITIVSPCSGHGAKFAPLIGEISADVASGRAPAPSPFRVGAPDDHSAKVPSHV